MDARKRVNYHVEVWPEILERWLGTRDALSVCHEIETAVRRHVDHIEAVHVVSDLVCKDCGGPWTEKSTVYNRGCCDADIDRGDSLAGDE